MQISILSSPNDTSAIKLKIQQKTILFVQGLSLTHLQYFSSEKKSNCLNQTGLFSGNYRFNFNFLKSVKLTQVDLIIVNSIQDFVILPFLFKQNYFSPIVIVSRPVAQAGIQYVHQFLNYHQKKVLSQQFISQSIAFDKMLQQFNIDMQSYQSLYDIKSIKKLQIQLIQLNLGQVYNNKNIQITFLSSGFSLGSTNCFLKSKITDQSIFYVGKSSITPKYCKPLQIPERVDYIMFSKLSNVNQKYYNKKKSLIQKVSQCLKIGSVILRMANQSQILQFNNLINNQFRFNSKVIFIVSSFYGNLQSQANKFIQFLSDQLKSYVLISPPKLPFQLNLSHTIIAGFQDIFSNYDYFVRLGNALYIVIQLHPRFGIAKYIKDNIKIQLPHQSITIINSTNYDTQIDQIHHQLIDGLTLEQRKIFFQDLTCQVINLDQGIRSIVANKKQVTIFQTERLQSLMKHKISQIQFSGFLFENKGNIQQVSQFNIPILNQAFKKKHLILVRLYQKAKNQNLNCSLNLDKSFLMIQQNKLSLSEQGIIIEIQDKQILDCLQKWIFECIAQIQY